MTIRPEDLVKILDTSWKRNAACSDIDYTYFFIPRYAEKVKDKFCADCPVKPSCLEYSLLTDSFGIWGGMTDIEREKKYSEIFRDSMREDYS